MNHILPFVFILFSISLAAQEGSPDVIRGNEQFELVVNLNEIGTLDGIDGVEVYLYKTMSDKLIDSKSTISGSASFMIDPETEYEIRTCHVDYFKNGLSIYECHEGDEVLCVLGASDYAYVAGGGKDKPKAALMANLSLKPLKVGSVLELEKVYYDLDKATLRPDGKSELDDLVAIMNRNKSIKVELSSHTDSRASDSYNMDLSQRRAQSCFDYITSQGIASDRIIPKGYGEQKLLNKCSNGVECSEAQHQRNRRTEIKVLEYIPRVCKPSKEIDFKIKDLRNDDNDQSK